MPSSRQLHVSATTHTVDMAQIAELNARLAVRTRLNAAQLGLGRTRVRSGGADELPPTAVLRELVWDGEPGFPYVHAVFAPSPESPARLMVDLHTPALRALCRLLSLHQIWGVGSAPPRR